MRYLTTDVDDGGSVQLKDSELIISVYYDFCRLCNLRRLQVVAE